jgi:methyl-accepting chemotaxis protein
MEEQSTGSKQILEAISRLNELTRHVKAGSSETREWSKQGITESENLEQVTGEITNAMKEMAEGTHQVGSAINRVKETVDHNKEYIGVMVEEVDKFKV